MSMLMRRAFMRGSAKNYATWNPSDKDASIALSNGNLTETHTTTYSTVRATIGKSSGKWYWEIVATASTVGIGVAKIASPTSTYPGGSPTSWAWLGVLSSIYTNGGSLGGYSTYAAGDVIGVALDMDAGTLMFYKGGVSQGVAVSGLTGTIYPVGGGLGYAAAQTANFGASPFAYTVPAGYNPGLF